MKQLLVKGLPVMIIILISLWGAFGFFEKGLPNTHDGQTHVMRLASFHQALDDGQFPPRWAGNLAYGYGSPVLSYYFPLPYIIADIFCRIGFSLIDSVKIVFILGYVLSGLIFFLFSSTVFGFLPGTIGSILYLLAPYRLLNLYVRGEMGESFIFLFPPLILWLLEKGKEKNIILYYSLMSLVIGLMFLSHQIMAGVFTIIILIYAIYRKIGLKTFVAVIGGLGVASFNLIPLIFERQYSNLVLFVENNFLNQFPTLGSVIYSKWNWGPALPDNPTISMSFQLGMAQWIVVALTLLIIIFNFKKISGKTFQLLIFLCLFLGILFLMNNFSEIIWKNILLIKIILYPWRLLGIEIFLTSIMASLVICLLKQTWIKYIIVILLAVVAFYGNRNHIQVNGRTIHDDQFYFSFPGTSDMWGEFLPINAKPPTEYTAKVTSSLPSEIIDLKVKSNMANFLLVSKTQNTTTINTFKYPGWQVYVDGQTVELDNSLVLTFKMPEGNHEIKALFKETPIRKIGNLISLVSIFLLSGIIFIYNLKRCEK